MLYSCMSFVLPSASVLCFFFHVLPAYSALLGTLISLLLLLLLLYIWLSAHLPPLCSLFCYLRYSHALVRSAWCWYVTL